MHKKGVALHGRKPHITDIGLRRPTAFCARKPKMFDLFVRTFQAWRTPGHTANELSRLSEAQLRDIGLVRNASGEYERRSAGPR